MKEVYTYTVAVNAGSPERAMIRCVQLARALDYVYRGRESMRKCAAAMGEELFYLPNDFPDKASYFGLNYKYQDDAWYIMDWFAGKLGVTSMMWDDAPDGKPVQLPLPALPKLSMRESDTYEYKNQLAPQLAVNLLNRWAELRNINL